MMEILRGSPALSAFRINKLLARFQAARLPVHNIYAEYVHFADLNAPLNDDEHAQLERLLKYGPALQEKKNCKKQKHMEIKQHVSN